MMILPPLCLAAFAAASEPARAPELPTLPQAQAELRGQTPPSSVAGQPVGPGRCASLDWSRLTLESGFMSSGSSFSLKSGKRKVGRAVLKSGRLVVSDLAGAEAFSARVEDGPGKGHTATVVDCAGRPLGSVEEVQATDGPVGYTLRDAAWSQLAWSGPVDADDSVCALSTPGQKPVARIESHGGFRERYELAVTGSLDGRLALATAALWSRAQLRQAERRNEKAAPALGQRCPNGQPMMTGRCLGYYAGPR